MRNQEREKKTIYTESETQKKLRGRTGNQLWVVRIGMQADEVHTHFAQLCDVGLVVADVPPIRACARQYGR